MEPQEYDELLRTLVRIAAHQETINADVRAVYTVRMRIWSGWPWPSSARSYWDPGDF